MSTATPSAGSGFDRLTHRATNVLLIMCDQLPVHALGCYGHPFIRTPHIDRLARDGARFLNAFAQNPVCCPSRASQLSALYPSNHGVGDNMANLEAAHPYARFLVDDFADAGYVTAHVGKWHCARNPHHTRWDEFHFLEESIPAWPQNALRRFDLGPNAVFYGDLLHAGTHPCSAENTGPARITDRALDFLDRFAYHPFFLRVSYLAPHSPVLAPRPYDTMYDPADVTLPPPLDDPAELDRRPAAVRDYAARCHRARAASAPAGKSEDALRRHIACSLGLISHVDDQIGRLLDRLRDLDLERNTLVIFTADHGAFWGELGLVEKSCVTMYRSLLQVPLLMRLPGRIPAGREIRGFAEVVDTLPTALDLAGVSLQHQVNGRSLAAALDGDESACRPGVFAEATQLAPTPAPGRGRSIAALRDHEWHFIYHAATDECELYRLTDDPHERRNLAHDSACRGVVADRKSRLLARLLTNRQVHLLPPEASLQRSPIHLAPGVDRRGHAEAMKRQFFTPAASDNLWPPSPYWET